MVIFINASINSGKTTVARLLTHKIPRTALVEIDAL
jgi:deoxyadenosine/deoxycytidine kinase